MGNYITRQYLFHAQRGRCHYCNVQMNLKYGGKNLCTRDHIIPKVKGGSNSRSNLVGSCITCNNMKGQIPYWAFKAYITLYGRDRRMKDVLRSLTTEEYEGNKIMWNAIQGSHSFYDPPPPVIHRDNEPAPALTPVWKKRRDILHQTRVVIRDIVDKTPFWQRNRIWGQHLKKEKSDDGKDDDAGRGTVHDTEGAGGDCDGRDWLGAGLANGGTISTGTSPAGGSVPPSHQ